MLRYPLLGKPFFRGIIVLGQSLAIGMRALMVSANQSLEEEERLTPRQVALSIVLALALFIGIFIIAPTTLFAWFENRTGGGGVLTLIGEGVFRVALFVAYLWLIGKTKDIHRVFEYHGAEHKTIAAFEHGEELEPDLIDRYPKEHVRCGTNFLIIVMIITIFVFTLFGTPALVWRIVSRVIAIPIIAAISYEALRFGAKHPGSLLMRGADGAGDLAAEDHDPAARSTPRSRSPSRRSRSCSAARRRRRRPSASVLVRSHSSRGSLHRPFLARR